MNNNNAHEETFSSLRRDLFVCLFLVLAIYAVYWQVSDHEFVYFDDSLYVTKNRYVQAGLSVEGFKWAFSFSEKGYWHPLTWLSHMLDCQLFGLNPGVHHLVNLMLHVANSVLLFLAFKRMTGARWQSAIVAALFALHPMNVESVAWVAGRKNLLSTLFWMLTMFTYVGYTEQPRFFRYVLVLIVFALGLLAKPMLVTLPLVLLLLDYWPLGRIRFEQSEVGSNERTVGSIFGGTKGSQAFRLVLEKIPLLAFSAFAINLSSLSVQVHGISISMDSVPVNLRIANAVVSYLKYIGNTIWPQNLAVFYPFPKMVPMWQSVSAAVLLICISLVVIRALKRAPYLTVGWLWYLGTLVPVIGLMQAGLWPAMADRWAYVPLIGIFIMVAWGLSALAARWHFKRIWLVAATAAVLSIFMITTKLQVGYWSDSITLFEHALKSATPCSAIHNNLGVALQKKGRIAEAISHYTEALRLNPNYAQAHNNLGITLRKQGRVAEAIRHFYVAVQVDPTYADPHFSIGNIMEQQGRITEAVRYYINALKLKPDYADAHTNLGYVLLQKGKVREALVYFQKAARLKPDSELVQNNLKSVLAIQRKIDEELANTQTALKQNPEDPVLYYKMGILYKKSGQLDEAMEQFRKALVLQPGFFDALQDLAIVLALKGEYGKALKLSEQMIASRPDEADAHYLVACLYARQNKVDESIAWLKQAIKKGYHNWDQLKSDKNLENIRSSFEYRELLKGL